MVVRTTTGGLPVLYSFRRCPYAIRARLALASTDTRCELREVVLRDKPEAMLRISAKGTVPVLQLADGQVIDESRDIMDWALARRDPAGWLNADGIATRALIEYNDESFKPQLDAYKYHVRHPQQPREYWRQQCLPFIDELEKRLRAHQGVALLGRQLTLADYALLPFIRQFAAVDRDWFATLPYPGVRQWLATFEISPLFLQVMKKYPPWRTGDAPTLFP